MGAWTTMGGPFGIAWFTEPDPLVGVERIKAVVVRRVMADQTRKGSGLLGALRSLWHRRMAAPALRAPRVRPPQWSGSVGDDGPGQVLYSRERGLVRTHGVEFAIPNDDRALIVLVDETAPDVAASIRTHTVRAPTSPWSRPDPRAEQDERKRRRREQFNAARTTWHAWLDSEPLIAAFVAEKGGS